MEKIASFTIDHIKLQPGLYVSRKDAIGVTWGYGDRAELETAGAKAVFDTPEETVQYILRGSF